MKSKGPSVLPPTASVEDKIAFIHALARLDPTTVGRGADDFPESLFNDSPVGRGYNIFGAFADNTSVQGAVLDFGKLKADGLVTSIPVNDTHSFTHEGSTLQKVSESMDVGVSVSGSGGFGAASFAGSMSSSFAKDTMFRHEYAYATFYHLHRVARVKLFVDVPRLRENYMTGLAADVLNAPTVPAEQVIDFFGTHVLVGAVYGARFEYSSATNTWAYAVKTSTAVAVEASFESVTASGSTSATFASEDEREEYESNSETRVHAAGGDAELAGGLGDFDAWKQTIDANDPVLVAFEGDRPLVPIWEFARDEARRRELQEAVEDIAKRIGAVVNGDTELVITAEVECLNASDEGGGNLELFGTIDVSILDARGDVVWEENMFSVPGSGKYVVLKKNNVHRCPSQTAPIPGSADPTGYTLRLRCELTERDPGSSGDDYLGLQVVETKFVEGRLLGEHVFRSRGDVLEFKFDVSLAD